VYIFYRKIFDISAKEKSAISTRNNLIITSIKNISSVKSSVLKDKIKSGWEDYQKNIDLKTTQKFILMDTLKDTSKLLSALLILGLIYFFAINIVSNKIGIGESISIILLMIISFNLIEKIIVSYPDYLKFTYAADRLNNILSQNIDTEKNVIINSSINPILKTKSVFISDKRGTPIINNLDMELHPGTLYIIKGKSTSISSFILKSLAGIYSPESGEIKIDKYNINNIAMESISNNIRYLSTEPIIFYGTLKENITCFYNAKITSHPLLTFEKLLSIFNIKNISENLPQGYNTVIDNNHENLSSEEIKIINIVRTLIGNPSMILIENPFVNLSNENRKNLIDLLTQISKEKLVIITSSNFDSDIKSAHTIAIKNGEIEIKENEFINKEISKRRSLFRKISTD
ncbi:MAG: ATP-binding cassette domain-containing protein, partial [Rickettsiales bacterium]|nr:ATP-binding cassette domain-containing protein [Rickettsiales bacterium]